MQAYGAAAPRGVVRFHGGEQRIDPAVENWGGTGKLWYPRHSSGSVIAAGRRGWGGEPEKRGGNEATEVRGLGNDGLVEGPYHRA
jgi:hypothetical protein